MGKTVRMLSSDGFISAAAIDATDIVQRAHEIHGTSATASAALGRALAIASLIGGGIKVENGSVTLQFAGGGPGGTMVVVSESDGSVRGCVQDPSVDLPRKPNGKLDVGSYVGIDGRLTVIKDLQMKDPYVGTVALVGGEIAEDVAAYFAESEQTPSVVAAGVLVNPGGEIAAAGAYIIQLMPGATSDIIDRLETAAYRAASVTEMLRESIGPEKMLLRLLDGFAMEKVEEYDAFYRCTCSRERVERALISIGELELDRMIREDGKAEVTCRFCDKVYRFSETDLRELLHSART